MFSRQGRVCRHRRLMTHLEATDGRHHHAVFTPRVQSSPVTSRSGCFRQPHCHEVSWKGTLRPRGLPHKPLGSRLIACGIVAALVHNTSTVLEMGTARAPLISIYRMRPSPDRGRIDGPSSSPQGRGCTKARNYDISSPLDGPFVRITEITPPTVWAEDCSRWPHVHGQRSSKCRCWSGRARRA